jgi:DsbC/DsbD-like thiol-disulfide interchange protein
MRITAVVLLLTQISLPLKPGHATVMGSPAEVDGKAGTRIALFVDVAPKAGIHVYAPGSKDYIAVAVKLNPQTQIKLGKLTYPKSEIMTLADERVPVFNKPFRLTQDVTLDKSAQPGATVIVAGTVTYQACDDRVCYPPESAPVSWMVKVK